MDTLNCDGATLDDSLYTGRIIPPIDQKTIECNLTRFTEWLNNLAEQVNYLSCLYLDMKRVVQENRERIVCLEGKVEIIDCDLVLFAMGFLRPEHPEYPANVFIAGDAKSGASLVVRAIASGRQVADDVDKFLKENK